MNRNLIPSKRTLAPFLPVGRRLACLPLLLYVCPILMGQTQSASESPVAGTAIQVTHVLGFESAQHNANGELRIQGSALQFQRAEGPAEQVSISSIRNIFLGQEDTQVGGMPMMLGKSAVPYGGGRVVSLFSHKKYDSLTVEYLDKNGGLHGAIFRLSKGQGRTFRRDLVANGAHTAPIDDQIQSPKHSGDQQ